MKYIYQPFCRKMILEVFPLQYLRISRTVLVTYGDDADPQMINCIIHKHTAITLAPLLVNVGRLVPLPFL